MALRKSVPASHSHSRKPMMRKTIDEVFGKTSLLAWKLRLDRGEVPSLVQIADIIEANKDVVLPSWLIEQLCRGLRFPDKPKRGRPPTKESHTDMLARCMYPVELAKFQAELKSALASGQQRARSDQPPSELAARSIQKTFYKDMTWRAVQNMFSSRNAPSRK
jgi:hypothetical protein